MKNYYLFIMLFISASLSAQVGIGTMDPSQSAELEISSADKGILIPRVSLTSLNSSSPIATTPEESLVVYNTTENASGLVKGFYYWTGSSWTILATKENINDLEAKTTIVYNNDGTYTYTGEDSIPITLKINENIDEFETLTALTYDNVKNALIYSDEDKASFEIDMGVIAKINETITSLGLNSDGKTLEYLDEKGTTSTIDLSLVIDDFETVTSLDFDPLTAELKYTDEDNNTNIIDLNDIVKSNETLTSLVDNEDGTLTYSDEKLGETDLDLNDNFWSTTGNAGLTDPQIGTKDQTDLNIISDDIVRGTVTKEGQFLWGMANSSSQFAVEGSQASTIKVTTSDYSAGNSDYVIVFKHPGSSTLTLPDAATNIGRMYIVLNYGASDLTISPAVVTGYNQTTSILTNGVGKEGGITFGNRVWLQSDGQNWLVIDN